MRNIILFITLCVLATACQKKHETASMTPQVASFSSANAMRTAGTKDSDWAFIPIDTANRMISSYLTSINYPANDTEIRSIIIDGDALRSYLTSPAGQNISQVKIIFAHNTKYINSGNYGKRPPMGADATTFVMAGFNDDGAYIPYYNYRVLDHSTPCPTSCPTVGAAANNLLQ